MKDQFEPINQSTLFAARNEVLDLHMSESLEEYLLQIILATRNPAAYGQDLAAWLQYGASPGPASRWIAVPEPKPGWSNGIL